MHRRRSLWAVLAAAGLALCLAAPAEAAKQAKTAKAKKHTASASVHAGKHRRAAAGAPLAFRFQGGVPAGPLYNGQDYLGDDPDPNIRSFLIRDKSRYGGVD
jgi:hypothetical protein